MYNTILITLRNCLVLFFCLSASIVFAQKGNKLSDVERQKFDISFVNGNREKILENYDEALKYFRFCYGLDPNNAALNFIIGETYFQKKQFEEAEQYTLTATKLDNGNIWYKQLLVDIYISRKKNNEAAQLLTQIARTQKDIDYFLKAAYLYAMIKEYKNAIKVLDEAEKNIGINEDIISRKEQIYLAQNKLDKAIKEVEKLINAFPTTVKYKGMLADLYWANGKAKQAVELYNQILAVDPNNGFALFALADYYKSITEYTQWYSYLKKGMASSDVEPKAKITVLSGFISGKEFDDQLKRTFELATIFVTANPGDPLPHLVLGDVYAQQQQFDSARLEYRKALLIEPATFIAWQQTVFCSTQLFNNNLLLADCEDAISYFPNEPAFFVYGAIAAMQLKQYTKAIEFAKSGLEVTTPDQTEMISQLNSTLGDAYHYAKNYTASDSIYEALLQKDSNNAYALNNYAYFLSLRKTQLDKAEQMSKKSIALDELNASYLDTYGWILFVKGDYIKAKDYIEKSLKLSPNNAEVIDHLGDVLYKTNDVKGAIVLWEKAQKLGSENPKLNQKIKEGKWYE